MRIAKLLFLFLGFYFGFATAQSAYQLNDNTPIRFKDTENVLVFEDSSNKLSFTDIKEKLSEFVPAKDFKSVTSTSTYWISQKINSNVDHDISLRVNQNSGWMVSHTNVINPNGDVKELTAQGMVGNTNYFSKINPDVTPSKNIKDSSATFILKANSEVQLITQLKAFPTFAFYRPNVFSIQVIDSVYYSDFRRYTLYLEGAMFGVLIALSIFGVYSAIQNTDSTTLAYAAWLILALMTTLGLPIFDGQRFLELFSSMKFIYLDDLISPEYRPFTPINLTIAGYFFALIVHLQLALYVVFTRNFIDTKSHFPKVHLLINYWFVFLLIYSFIWQIYIGDALMQKLQNIHLILNVFILLCLFYFCYRRYKMGLTIAKYFLLAMIPYLLFRTSYVLGLVGIPSPFSFLPNSGFGLFLQYSWTNQGFGICCEAIIMSLASVSRMRSIQSELTETIQVQKTLVENQNKVLEETVAERTKELAETARELEAQHQELDEAHQLVVGSVNYASRLQRGQLPRQMRIDGRFASFASIWEPRDTIGGDLYWLSSSQQSGPFVLAVADCTGHGVPGAMLSLLVSNSLERIYANDTTEDPASALMSLDHYVRTGLNQDRADSESDDGCDAAVLRIDRDKKTIEFAGAKLGLFQVSSDGLLTRHTGSRCSLGYQDAVIEADKPVLKTIGYSEGDIFAIVTDGLTDQIGGASGKTSYGYRRLKEVLKANCAANAEEITAAMKSEFAAWQGANARRDDVTAVVFRL